MKQNISVDAQKIKNAARLGLPVSVTTYTFPRKVAVYIDIILMNFLQELHHPEMQDFLSYMINELATNAKKANTKRAYFIVKNLDINNAHDYDMGMRSFKTDMLVDTQHYLQLQKDTGLYIKVVMQYFSGNFVIDVRNNSELTKTEFKRISDKIARSQKYTTLEEALPEVFDDDEGTGLGLIISLLMMRKLGVPDENFLVLSENGETIMRVIVPIIETTPANISGFSKQIASYIEAVPEFPENIMRIERLLDNPNTDMLDIAAHIASDVALSTDLLKQVNSAAYGLKQKVVSIPYAVSLIGMRGIRNLLYTIGVMNIFGADSEKQSELWTLSHKAAFYASRIARNIIRKTGLNDLAYVCGLLHNLGRIVISCVYPDPELKDKILKLKDSHHIPDNVFDTLTSEINHPEIGAALAEKWNFPPAIVNAIRFQHDYKKAPEEFRELAALVSLVDIMIHWQSGEIEFYQINPELLKIFSLSGEEAFKTMCDKLDAEFTASLAAEHIANQGADGISAGSA